MDPSQPGVGEATIAQVCGLTQTRCTGNNTQYASLEDCVQTLSQKRLGDYNEAFGDTVTCRTIHLVLVQIRPKVRRLRRRICSTTALLTPGSLYSARFTAHTSGRPAVASAWTSRTWRSTSTTSVCLAVRRGRPLCAIPRRGEATTEGLCPNLVNVGQLSPISTSGSRVRNSITGNHREKIIPTGLNSRSLVSYKSFFVHEACLLQINCNHCSATPRRPSNPPRLFNAGAITTPSHCLVVSRPRQVPWSLQTTRYKSCNSRATVRNKYIESSNYLVDLPTHIGGGYLCFTCSNEYCQLVGTIDLDMHHPYEHTVRRSIRAHWCTAPNLLLFSISVLLPFLVSGRNLQLFCLDDLRVPYRL